MDINAAREISERDQLWASLRNLRAAIDRLADGEFDSSIQQQQMIVVLARIVAAELDFRAGDALADK